jgi:CheY-like chemotaxis protein
MAKILIIDDEELVRLTVRQTLELAGHTVMEASNGVDGMDMYTRHQPDVVITDIIMPEKEGIETIKELRRARADLPIIAVSGGGRTGNMNFLEMAARLGATRAIHKPFDVDELPALVDEVLGG